MSLTDTKHKIQTCRRVPRPLEKTLPASYWGGRYNTSLVLSVFLCHSLITFCNPLVRATHIEHRQQSTKKIICDCGLIINHRYIICLPEVVIMYVVIVWSLI